MWWSLVVATALAATKEPPGAEHAATKATYERPRVVVAGGVDDLVFPALRVGGEFPVLVGVTNRRTKKGRLRNGVGELFVAVHGGGWVEPRNVVPLYVAGEVGTRWTGPTGGFVAAHTGAGLILPFNGGDTLRVADDGTVTRAPLAVRPGWLGQVALSFGYDVGKKHAAPLRIGLKQGIGLYAPFNTGHLGVVLTELTFAVRLDPARRTR